VKGAISSLQEQRRKVEAKLAASDDAAFNPRTSLAEPLDGILFYALVQLKA